MRARKDMIRIVIIILGIILCSLCLLIARMVYQKAEKNVVTIHFDVMEDIPLSEHQKEYSAIVKAVLNQDGDIQVKKTSNVESLMDYFIQMNPLAFFIKSYEMKDNCIHFIYKYDKKLQKHYLTQMIKNVKALMSISNNLNKKDLVKVFCVYSNVTSDIKYVYENNDSLGNSLVSKKSSEKNYAKICVFALLQLKIKTYYIQNTSNSKDCFLAYINKNPYYFYPADEALTSSGRGLTYFGVSSTYSKELFGTSNYIIVSKREDAPECKSGRLYMFHNTCKYEIVEKNILRLYRKNDTVSTVDLSNLTYHVEKQQGFLKKHLDNGVQYYLYQPRNRNNLNVGDSGDQAKSKTKQYPLIIFLHGASEHSRGLTKYGIPHAKIEFQNEIGGAYILILLSMGDYYKNPLDYLNTIHEVLRENTQINRKQIILYGFSNGAKFSCELMKEEPDLFSAAILSGCPYEWDDNNIAKLTKLPIWLVIGNHDSVPFIHASKLMYRKFKKAGGDITFHEFNDRGHVCAALSEYVEDLGESALDWIKRKVLQ